MGNVFISYSHKDEKYKDQLVTQLKVLNLAELLTWWDDRHIKPGENWYPEIEKAIESADVAILLISDNYLSSEFILSKEVPALLKKRAKKDLRVIPLIVWPCPWETIDWLSPIQVRPKDGRALSSMTEHQVKQDMASLAKEIFNLLNGGPPPDRLEPLAPEPYDDIRIYKKKAEAFHETLPAMGFKTQINVPVNVGHIYVPLWTILDLSGVGDKKFSDANHAKQCLDDLGNAKEISLEDVFLQTEKRGFKGIVILGDPGSGKTTHLKRLILWCLQDGPETIGLPKGMLPIFVPLRNLNKQTQALDDFILEQLAASHPETSPEFGRRMLGRGNLLLLFDGLDEVADTTRREQVAEWIVKAQQEDPTSRFVVTCRFAGYSEKVRLCQGFLEMHIRPFTGLQAGNFIHKWYQIVERRLATELENADNIALKKARNLIKRLKERDFRARRVFEMTRNPLLLTNICLVHRRKEGQLPSNRAGLYEECIDVLLAYWRDAKGLSLGMTASEGREVLQPAALWLHNKKGRTRAKAAELAPLIKAPLKEVGWGGGSAGDFLRTIRDESGLLTGWDQEHYGFMHLGFQEYLTAREIHRIVNVKPKKNILDKLCARVAGLLNYQPLKKGSIDLQELASHFGESWWQEVVLLLMSLGEPSHFEALMQEVCKLPVFAKHLPLVEMCIDEAGENVSILPFAELLKKEPGKDAELWLRQYAALRLIDRQDPTAVDPLNEIIKGHPYPAIRRWVKDRKIIKKQHSIRTKTGGYELVKIPGGTFIMGSPEAEKERRENESPQHRVTVPGFYLGRYPVTNKEYEIFLMDNPNVNEPEFWSDRKFNQPMQPVVGISWFDAGRYAEWANLRLPSEAEWEYSCRAKTSTAYYSGDTEKDLYEVGWYISNSDRTSKTVGAKMPNRFGLYDMHGNVWEWMEDDWHELYDNAPSDGRAWVDPSRNSFRVMRGGCWYYAPHRCRSGARGNFRPNLRNSFLGFRLAKSL